MECKVKINNFDYVVKVIDAYDERLKMPDGDYHFGVTNFKDKEIYIADNLPDSTMENTLLHELTHAFIDSYGLLQVEWNDEIVADFIATYLTNFVNIFTTITVHILNEREFEYSEEEGKFVVKEKKCKTKTMKK